MWKQVLESRLGIPTSRRAVLARVGGWLADSAFKSQRDALEQLDGSLEGLESFHLGKAAGCLAAAWLLAQTEQEDASESLLEELAGVVKQLDSQSETPQERALTRFLASKTVLALEGFTSSRQGELPRYQQYQQEAKILLKILPQHQRISKKDIFLGRPFAPETVFVACHRFLTATCLSQDEQALQAFLRQWLARPVTDAPGYYAQLLALTYRQQDAEQLTQNLERWFEAYREYLQDSLASKQKWTQRTLHVLGGDWLSLLQKQ